MIYSLDSIIQPLNNWGLDANEDEDETQCWGLKFLPDFAICVLTLNFFKTNIFASVLHFWFVI